MNRNIDDDRTRIALMILKDLDNMGVILGNEFYKNLIRGTPINNISYYKHPNIREYLEKKHNAFFLFEDNKMIWKLNPNISFNIEEIETAEKQIFKFHFSITIF